MYFPVVTLGPDVSLHAFMEAATNRAATAKYNAQRSRSLADNNARSHDVSVTAGWTLVSVFLFLACYVVHGHLPIFALKIFGVMILVIIASVSPTVYDIVKSLIPLVWK